VPVSATWSIIRMRKAKVVGKSMGEEPHGKVQQRTEEAADEKRQQDRPHQGDERKQNSEDRGAGQQGTVFQSDSLTGELKKSEDT